MPNNQELQNKVSFIACLRLEGEDLVPDQVTQCLGVEPDSSWKRGDPYKSPRKNPEKLVMDRGGWCLSIDGEWGESLVAVLRKLFSWVESKGEELTMLSAKYNGIISIGLCYQTNYICSPALEIPIEIVKKIGDMNLAIVVNVYPCSTPDSECEPVQSCEGPMNS